MKPTLSRRTFVGKAGVATALGLRWPMFEKSITDILRGSSTGSVALLPMWRIVDMHVHYRHHEPGFLDTFLKLSDRLHLTGCILTPFEHRKVVAEAAKRHPKQIIPFGAVDVDAP